MKDIVIDRINRIEDLEQRKLLKQMMTGLFMNLVDYQEQVNKQLEQRVFQEVKDDEDMYTIYASICAKDEADPIHDFLFPMIPEDLQEPSLTLETLSEAIASQQRVVLETLYLQCSHSQLKHLLSQKRSFKAKLVTTARTVDITCELRLKQQYLQVIETLYQLFQSNGMPWRTVNHPHLMKFVDVVLSRAHQEVSFDEEEALVRIETDLEEFSPYKLENMIPLWNVEQLEMRTMGFPIAASDKVNYEHVLNLRKPGNQHGYLVQTEEDIRYLKRDAEELTIVTPRDKSDIWPVWKITQPTEESLKTAQRELFSNQRQLNFIGKYANKQPHVIRSEAEIYRIVNSFEASSELTLVRIEQRSNEHRHEACSYALNPFINDGIRSDRGEHVLRLCFEANRRSYVNEDLISFLVSEVQRLLPDYRIEGVLL